MILAASVLRQIARELDAPPADFKRERSAVLCDACNQPVPSDAFLKCKACGVVIHPADTCKAAHFDTHQPRVAPVLPAGCVARCATCERPMRKGQYLVCSEAGCEARICKTGDCRSLHRSSHTVARLRKQKGLT